VSRSALEVVRFFADLSAYFRQRFCKTAEVIYDFEVRGRAEFIRRTRGALDLLRLVPSFPDIQRYVAVIQQGGRSGMHAARQKPTFVVGKRTWSHSALWYAGAIAHDAHHSKLYHDGKGAAGVEPPADCWTGKEAERKCLAFQIEVLRALNADEPTVAYLEELRKNPTYQGHNKGLRGWAAYLMRRW